MKWTKPIVLGLASMCVISTAMAAELKIGVVNMERILRESVSAQRAGDRLNQDFQRRQEDIDNLTKQFKARLERFEKNANSMSENERLQERRSLAEIERDVTRREREARDEFNLRRQDEVIILQDRAAKIIERMAQEGHYDLVLTEAFYASPRVDLTDKIIQELDKGAKR